MRLHRSAKILCKRYIDKFWQVEDLPKKANKSIYDINFRNNAFTVRFKQLIAVKALDMIRSVRAKLDKKKYVYEMMKRESNPNAKSLLDRINETKLTKPNIKNFSLDLNGNFVKFSDNLTEKAYTKNKSTHPNWIILKSLGKTYNVNIPFDKTRIYNKYASNGFTRSNYLQITKTGEFKVVFSKKIKVKQAGEHLGCDIGYTDLFTLNDGISANSLLEKKQINESFKKIVDKAKFKKKR